MSILLPAPGCVHAALDNLLGAVLDPDAPEVVAEDQEWHAEVSASSPPPEPDCFTDLAWLIEESEALFARKPDPVGACGLCGDCLLDLIHSMRFARLESAAAYLDDPHSPVRRKHLIYLQPRRAGGYQSPLAEAVGVEAAYYLHLDTDAGNLAAWHMLRAAEECEEFGSRTAGEYAQDQAAYRAAMIAAVMEAGESEPDVS